MEWRLFPLRITWVFQERFFYRGYGSIILTALMYLAYNSIKPGIGRQGDEILLRCRSGRATR
jgi:hypothetical protein